MLFRSCYTNRQGTIDPVRVIGSSEPYSPIAETSTDSPSSSRFPTQTTDDFTSKIKCDLRIILQQTILMHASVVLHILQLN